MPLPFPFTVYGANRSSNSGGGGASCDFTYCYGGDWVQGKVGNYGMSFDSSASPNQYITVNNISDITSQQKGTVSMWISSSGAWSGEYYPTLLASADEAVSNTYWEWYVDSTDSKMKFAFYNAGSSTTNFDCDTPLSANTWHHVAISSDGTTSKMYLDGAQNPVGSPNAGNWFGDLTGPDNITIGYMLYGGGLDFPFGGKIDEVAIWDVPLTDAQISTLSTGSARADSFTPPEIISAGSWVSGKLDDYSLQFGNGPTGANARHNDRVEIPYTSSMEFTTQDFSIGCWVKVHATQTYQGIVSNDISSGGYKGWVLGTVAAGQFTFSTRHPSYSPNVVYTYSAIQSNVDTEWHHVVGVRDGIYNRLYVNGTASATPTTMTSIADNGSIPYRLGQWWNNNDNLSGQCDLDEVGLWNVALDPGAIDELYNSGDGVLSNTVSSSNMVAYYNMESGPGSGTLVDRTGNGNNGTLTNMNNGTTTTGSLLMYYDFEIGDNNPVSGNFPGNDLVYDVVTASFHGPTAHTGTMTAMTQADFGAWGQGKLGKYSFSGDGSDDYIAIASSSYLPLGGGDESFSVSFWANTSGSTTSYNTVIGRHDSLTTTNDLWRTGWNIQYNHGQSQTMRFSVGSYYDATEMAYKTWSTAANTTFRHVVATYNTDTDVSQLWIDGVKGTDGTKAVGTYGANPGTGIVQIGGLGNIAGYSWPGSIDEVAIWDGVLDTGSIANLAAGAKANAITTATGSATPGDWLSPGKEGNYALHMPGGSGYIGINNKSDLGPSSGTVAFWAKINNTSTSERILASTSPQGVTFSSINTSWTFKQAFWAGNGYINIAGGDGPGGAGKYYYITHYPSITFTDWNHYAWTWASPVTNGGTEVKLYINGTYTGDTPICGLGDVTVGGGIASQEANLFTGFRGSYTPATGSMDEFGVWDAPLSAADIASLHNGTLSNAISSSNLILYYDFEGGPGNSTVVDRSTAGNDHTGDFNSMTAGSGAPAAATLSSYLDMECDGPGSTNVLDLSGNSVSGTLVNSDAGTCIQPGIANTYSVLLDNPSYVMTKYLEAADSSVLDYDGASDFSYSVWVKWNSASATTRYIVSKVDSATRGFYIYAGSTGDLYARIGESNTTNFRYTALTSGNGLTNDVWTHIAVVWNNSLQEITLYATPSGGSTVSSTNSVSTNGTVADVSNSETAVIGRRSSITTGIYHWYGNIDEVSFWSKALSSAEVTEIWNGGTPTDLESHSATSDLTNWWRMGDDASDDLTGGTGQVTDVKGTSNLTPEGTSAGDKDADVPS